MFDPVLEAESKEAAVESRGVIELRRLTMRNDHAVCTVLTLSLFAAVS